MELQNLAKCVVISEWIAAIGAISIEIWLVCRLANYSEDYYIEGPDIFVSTAIIWMSLILTGSIIGSIFLAVLLTKGIYEKSRRNLEPWIITHYIFFVLTFILIILSLIGYINILNLITFLVTIVSLIYRFFILKVISEYSESIKLDEEEKSKVKEVGNGNNTQGSGQENGTQKKIVPSVHSFGNANGNGGLRPSRPPPLPPLHQQLTRKFSESAV